VQEGVFPAVIRKLRDRISTLRVGDPLDKNTDIGAINSRMQLDKICELVESGLQQGAELVQPRMLSGCLRKAIGIRRVSSLELPPRIGSLRRKSWTGPKCDDFPDSGRSN
jgi:hypothetical protein